MSSISNMFVNLNYLTKGPPNTDNTNSNTNSNTNTDNTDFPALNQGTKYKKYQKKIKKSLEGDAIDRKSVV
jgi:hypothetical protein